MKNASPNIPRKIAIVCIGHPLSQNHQALHVPSECMTLRTSRTYVQHTTGPREGIIDSVAWRRVSTTGVPTDSEGARHAHACRVDLLTIRTVC